MDFIEELRKHYSEPDFGKARLVMDTKARPYNSLSSVEKKSIVLDFNSAVCIQYSDTMRYIIAKDITFDLLVTIYEVNTMDCVAFRTFSMLEKKEMAKILSMVRKFRSRNIEVRAIGMQNVENNFSTIVDNICKATKGSLAEVDLFGNERRHISIDLKNGVSRDVLLENRHYRPGELVNAQPVTAMPGYGNKFRFA